MAMEQGLWLKVSLLADRIWTVLVRYLSARIFNIFDLSPFLPPPRQNITVGSLDTTPTYTGMNYEDVRGIRRNCEELGGWGNWEEVGEIVRM